MSNQLNNTKKSKLERIQLKKDTNYAKNKKKIKCKPNEQQQTRSKQRKTNKQ